MIQQLSQSLTAQVNKLLTVMEAIEQTEGLNSEQKDLYNLLTLLLQCIVRNTEVNEHCENLPSDDLAEFVISLVSSNKEVVMRKLFDGMLSRSKRNNAALIRVSEVSKDTFYRYTSGRTDMNVDNFETLINNMKY